MTKKTYREKMENLLCFKEETIKSFKEEFESGQKDPQKIRREYEAMGLRDQINLPLTKKFLYQAANQVLESPSGHYRTIKWFST